MIISDLGPVARWLFMAFVMLVAKTLAASTGSGIASALVRFADVHTRTTGPVSAYSHQPNFSQGGPCGPPRVLLVEWRPYRTSTSLVFQYAQLKKRQVAIRLIKYI